MGDARYGRSAAVDGAFVPYPSRNDAHIAASQARSPRLLLNGSVCRHQATPRRRTASAHSPVG